MDHEHFRRWMADLSDVNLRALIEAHVAKVLADPKVRKALSGQEDSTDLDDHKPVT